MRETERHAIAVIDAIREMQRRDDPRTILESDALQALSGLLYDFQQMKKAVADECGRFD